MKRDMDLVRTILLEMEKQPLQGPDEQLTIGDFDDETITYHVLLMHEAGLLAAIETQTLDGSVSCIPVRLTWEGHEFLEAIRDLARWGKLKSAMNQLGGFVFDVGKTLATSWMLEQANLKP